MAKTHIFSVQEFDYVRCNSSYGLMLTHCLFYSDYLISPLYAGPNLILPFVTLAVIAPSKRFSLPPLWATVRACCKEIFQDHYAMIMVLHLQEF